MRRRSQLLLAIFAVIVATAAASHFALHWLGITTIPLRQWTVESSFDNHGVVAIGSSLTFHGLSVKKLSEQWHRPVTSFWLPSASSAEFEQLNVQVPNSDITLVGLSVYDQNEYIFSDYRAEIVPLAVTISDLWKSEMRWSFSKRLVAQYPLKYVRWVFPTAGRSLGVMVGLKAKLVSWQNALLRHAAPKAEFDSKFEKPVDERLSDWPPGQLADRLAILKVLSQGKHEFHGPKKRALDRLLTRASEKGRVIAVVLPVSPEYRRALLTQRSLSEFEAMIEDTRRRVPNITWLRLDHSQELDSDSVFYDLAHMNESGKQLATAAVIRELRGFSLQ